MALCLLDPGSMSAVTCTSLLVVDDEITLATALARTLSREGYQVRTAHTVEEATRCLEREPVDACLIDFHLPDGTGAAIARWALINGRARRAFCMTGAARTEVVVEAMRAGFTDVIEKPVNLDALIGSLGGLPQVSMDLIPWKEEQESRLIGHDETLLSELRIVRRSADTDCTVLITGESGTGKELIASLIHQASPRRSGPFVAINCAAIPQSLIEAELFGHTRGAFTGATAARSGKIAAADGGTLFLDEVGDLPLEAQAKLLRVLQDRRVETVGSDQSSPVDVRIVAATNRDLEAMVDRGEFRADLYFRLDVVRVNLPPLRERPGDILLLARHFILGANRRMNRAVEGLDRSAEQALLEHPWPGNVRELGNVIERAVILRRTGLISAADLQLRPRQRQPSSPGLRLAPAPLAPPEPQPTPRPALVEAPQPAPLPRAVSERELNLKSALEQVERELIGVALERTNGNRTEAAALLGLNRTTLVEKMRKFG